MLHKQVVELSGSLDSNIKNSIPAAGETNTQTLPINVVDDSSDRTFNSLTSSVSKSLKKLRHFLANKFAALVASIEKISDESSPILKKLKEFAGILTFVTASFGGVFIGIASILNVNIAKKSFIESLAMLIGSLTPASIAVVYGVVLLVSLSLLINKIFFQDPFDQMTKKLKEERGTHIDSLNQNQLLLSQIENKNEALQEKINSLRLIIQITAKNYGTVSEGQTNTPMSRLELPVIDDNSRAQLKKHTKRCEAELATLQSKMNAEGQDSEVVLGEFMGIVQDFVGSVRLATSIANDEDENFGKEDESTSTGTFSRYKHVGMFHTSTKKEVGESVDVRLAV